MLRINLNEFSGKIVEVNIRLCPKELNTEDIKPTNTINFHASLLSFIAFLLISIPHNLNKSKVKTHITLTRIQAIILSVVNDEYGFSVALSNIIKINMFEINR